jgi:PDZ domain-containing protein
MSSVGSAIRSALDSVRWDERHKRLARHPLLAACSRTDIRRIVKAGDELTVGEGEMVAQADTIGYWFVLVLAGELVLSRRGRTVGTLGPGTHTGEVAILGFGPQPATVRATTPSRLFVIGRRDFLSLAYNLPALQGRLFPGVPASGFVEHVRSLWIESDLAWRRLQRRREHTVARSREEALRFFHPPAADRGTFSRLAVRAFRPTVSPESPVIVAPRMSRRARVLVLSGVFVTLMALIGGSLTLYHPPIVVVTPGRPIDITDDITVKGAAVDKPNGHYLLTPVRYDQPSLFGAAVAVVKGRTTVPLDRPTSDDTLASVRAGEARFRSSQRDAADLAVRAAGLDPATVTVEFRSRTLQGTSAGLVYAIALADMLDPADLAGGRTIAVTGTLDPDGRIQPVAFVWIKADAARRGGATLFLVPRGQAPLAATSGAEVTEVESLDDALARLRR